MAFVGHVNVGSVKERRCRQAMYEEAVYEAWQFLRSWSCGLLKTQPGVTVQPDLRESRPLSRPCRRHPGTLLRRDLSDRRACESQHWLSRPGPPQKMEGATHSGPNACTSKRVSLALGSPLSPVRSIEMSRELGRVAPATPPRAYQVVNCPPTMP